ncbi:MAG: BatA domain-containing protein, partial [Planctomycetota bacterium]
MIPSLVIGQVGALFIAPWVAGIGVAAVALPIAIHMLSRLRRRREPWAAMRLLQEAFRRQRARLRMERWLLLAVRCLLVGLLGLALAGPVSDAWGGLAGRWAAGWLGVGGGGRVIDLVVDDSVGSRVRGDGGEARWEAVRALALEV